MIPPIPASCSSRPTVGGLVAPWVNIRLADGGVDFRTPDQKRFTACWEEQRCQTCGEKLGAVAVLFGGPRQVRMRRFDEPPLCPPCAVYASQACPMVAGRQATYADRERLSETKRGHVCPDADCACGGFVASDPNSYDASGEPAHDWYAVYVRTGAWQITAHEVHVRCSDGGCNDLHRRVLVNGCQLLDQPRKVFLVSSPGRGRLWLRLDDIDVHALTIEPEGETCPR